VPVDQPASHLPRLSSPPSRLTPVRYKVIGEYGDVIRLEDKVVRPVLPDETPAEMPADPAADAKLSTSITDKGQHTAAVEPAHIQPTKAVAWIPETRAV
jgi:hypothetical protein